MGYFDVCEPGWMDAPVSICDIFSGEFREFSIDGPWGGVVELPG